MAGPNGWTTKREREGAFRRLRPVLTGKGRSAVLRERSALAPARDRRETGLIALLASNASSGARKLQAAVWRRRFLAVVLPFAGWVNCSIIHLGLWSSFWGQLQISSTARIASPRYFTYRFSRPS